MKNTNAGAIRKLSLDISVIHANIDNLINSLSGIASFGAAHYAPYDAELGYKYSLLVESLNSLRQTSDEDLTKLQDDLVQYVNKSEENEEIAVVGISSSSEGLDNAADMLNQLL